MNIKNKNDNKSGTWCEAAHLHKVEVNACSIKGNEKTFDETITSDIILENEIILKDIPNLGKANNLMKNVFKLDENRNRPQIFYWKLWSRKELEKKWMKNIGRFVNI